MPSSKTDTAYRLPKKEDQQRRLRNVTQDRKAAARAEAEATSAKKKAEDSTTWSPEQLLGSQLDSDGSPVPNPVTTSDGAKERKKKKGSTSEESDLYDAMHEEFD